MHKSVVLLSLALSLLLAACGGTSQPQANTPTDRRSSCKPNPGSSSARGDLYRERLRRRRRHTLTYSWSLDSQAIGPTLTYTFCPSGHLRRERQRVRRSGKRQRHRDRPGGSRRPGTRPRSTRATHPASAPVITSFTASPTSVEGRWRGALELDRFWRTDHPHHRPRTSGRSRNRASAVVRARGDHHLHLDRDELERL